MRSDSKSVMESKAGVTYQRTSARPPMSTTTSTVRGKALHYQSASIPLQLNSLQPHRQSRKVAGGERSASVLASLDKNFITEPSSESNVSRYKKISSDGSTSDELVFVWVNNAADSASLVVYRSTKERLRNPECLNLDKRNLDVCPVIKEENRLRLLNYQNNNISVISNLENLTNLIFLDFYNNNLQSLGGSLSWVPGLRVFMAGKNSISEISNLNYLKKLDVLDLHSNEITEIQGLESLTELRVLNLAGNRIKRMANLSCLRSLTELNMRRNRIESIHEIETLPALERLFLSHNSISCFSKIKSLLAAINIVELSLDGNPLTESDPSSYRMIIIENMPKLRHLDLRPVTPEERVFGAQTRLKEYMEEKEKQGSSSSRLSDPIATWNDGSRSYDQQTLRPSLSSSMRQSTLLTKNDEKIKINYSEKEKFLQKEEKEMKIDKKQNSKETEEFRKLVSSSSSLSSSFSSSLQNSTYPISHEINQSIDSKNFNDKFDNNRNKKNGRKIGINEDDDIADNFTFDIRNLKVQGLSDDGALLIIEDVDWTWQQGHFIEINNGRNQIKNERNEEVKGIVERNEGRKEIKDSREQDNVNLSRDRKQEKDEKEERTSFISPYLQGLTHICIHFMSYSTILNEVAANAHSLPNITSLRLFNNDISTLKQVSILINSFHRLEHLSVYNNPICLSEKSLRSYVARTFPNLKYFNDVIITEFDRMKDKISNSQNDILHSSSDYHPNNGPRTYLESDLRHSIVEVELKNLETGFGLNLGPSDKLESRAYIDDSEETMQDSAKLEENWKEKYRIQKEKERKIMRGMERGKERELERIEEIEKEKAKEKGKERWEGRDKEKDYRRIVDARTGKMIGLDRVIEAEAKRENNGITSKSYNGNENIKSIREWEEEEVERNKEQNRERDMKARRERDKEKDREEKKKRENEMSEEEETNNKKEMKEMEGSKNITRHTTGAENGVETETERESPSSLPSNSRVTSLTPSSSTATFSSSSSSSLLRSITAATSTSTSIPTPNSTSTSVTTSNSATLSNPSFSIIPPIISLQDTSPLKDRTQPSIDEIELEKVFRKNFDDLFRKIIYETLETIKKEKNP